MATNLVSVLQEYHPIENPVRRRGQSGHASRIAAVCCFLFCLFPFVGSGKAQQRDQTDLGGMSIEELSKVKVDSVYGASKFLQKAGDAPASVTVVTAEEIQKYGYRTLVDVLQAVRGFYVINDRNYSYVGVRGLSRPGDYNACILFLVDGHRANDNIYDGFYIGSGFPVALDLIDRIEIVADPIPRSTAREHSCCYQA